MKLMMGLFLLLSLGCASVSPNNNGVMVISQGEYEKRIEVFSRKIETYQGLINTIHMSATLLNSQVIEAQLLQKARLFQWDQTTLDSERQKALEEVNKTTQIFVSLYTPEKKHDDLHKNQTLWKIFMDANGKRYEGKVKKIKLLTDEIRGLYAYHTRFATPYSIVFPVSVRSIENTNIKLTVTGPVGSATVQFKSLTQ